MSENTSEVARIREQIRRECEALERMQYSFASVASHASVIARYNNLGRYQEALEKHVGQDAATQELVQMYIEVIG